MVDEARSRVPYHQVDARGVRRHLSLFDTIAVLFAGQAEAPQVIDCRHLVARSCHTAGPPALSRHVRYAAD